MRFCLKLNNLGNDPIIYDRLPFADVSRKKGIPKTSGYTQEKKLSFSSFSMDSVNTFSSELSEIFRKIVFRIVLSIVIASPKKSLK